MSNSTSEAPITILNAILVFLGFVAVMVVVIFIKKIYYRFKYNKRVYIFPRINIRGITNIALVISIGIAILLLLTVITAGILGVLFRAYPGWRVSIEGILIKIGGLLFGPILGMFIGATTDLLSVALTAGMFHYGYFVAAVAYGLISGIIRSLLNLSKNNSVRFAVFSTLVMIAIEAAAIIFISTTNITFTINFLNMAFKPTKLQVSLILGTLITLGIITLWLCLFIFYRPTLIYSFSNLAYTIKFKLKRNIYRNRLKQKDNVQLNADKQLSWFVEYNKSNTMALRKLDEKKQKINNPNGWFSYFLPVLITIFICEIVVSLFLLPEFDDAFSPMQGYSFWFCFRLLMLTVMIPLNIAIIFPVYRIIKPAMKYNYTKDLVESRRVPYIIK